MFFESQLEELVEDLELGSKSLPYKEGLQRPGDVVFIPKATIFTSLTYADAASIRGRPAPLSALSKIVDDKLWSPEGGAIPDSVAAAACYGDSVKLFDAQRAHAARAGVGVRGGRQRWGPQDLIQS